MPHDVTMPQLGMAQDAGRIVAWLKKPGDAVREGDALFEVETDKATMEVEAQAAGFLSNVSAAEGDDVPVGQVIALITETAEAEDTPRAAETPSPEASDDLPAGRDITMPQLGMAQDSGLLVAWHVALGDQVGEGTVLFEVETDKSTMEVEADAAGYVAALLAGEGEDVPVGERVAIISDSEPDAPVQRRRGEAPAPEPQSEQANEPAVPAAAETSPAKKSPPPRPEAMAGRILASPKARRLALEQGLDLARLVDAGHPQPFHVSDLDVLRSLPAEAPVAVAAGSSRRITADVPGDGFAQFAQWAAENEGFDDARALLAGFVSAGLRSATGKATVCVTVEDLSGDRAYVDADLDARFGDAASGAVPDLLVRDLRRASVSEVALGAEAVPVLTILARPDGLSVTLECGADQLSPAAAINLVTGVAGRLEEPLRHLL